MALVKAEFHLNGAVSVLTRLEDGTNHRKTFLPGQSTDGLPEELTAAVSAFWTPAILQEWEERMQAEEN